MNKFILSNEISEKLRQEPDLNLESVAKFLSQEEITDKNSEFYLPKLRDCVILVIEKSWKIVKQFHDLGEIHIGLRNFNFSTVKSMPYVSLANNVKLVCSSGYIDNEIDISKLEMFRDSNFDRPIPRLEKFDIIFDLSKVKECLEKVLKLNPEGEAFGFDFETRGFPLRKKFKPLGFSIVGSNYGFYIDFRNNTNWVSEEFFELRKFIEENYKRLITFNCKFEIAVIEHMWGEKLKFPDAMAMVLCEDYRPNRKTVPGLKPCAQKFLQVPSWDDDLEFEQKYFNTVCRNYQTGKEFLTQLTSNSDVILECSNKTTISIKSDLNRIIQEAFDRQCADFDFSQQEKDDLLKKIKNDYKSRIETAWGNEWELSDPYTLGKYCIFDSFYTKLIWDYFKDKFPRAEPIYNGNYHYGSFIEDSGIPINRKRLNILKNYSENVKINSGVFLSKFYLMCLEDLISDYVDKELNLSEFTQNLIIDFPKLIQEEPDKVLKELLKNCKDPSVDFRGLELDKVQWGRFLKYMSKDLAREIWSLTKNDGTIDSACRRHRKQWIELGENFQNENKYKGLIQKINDRNLEICKPYMKTFNQEVKDFVSPFDPNDCKLVGFYFEDSKLKSNPYKVLKDHPSISKSCFEFVRSIQKEWDEDYWKENYLGGKTFKKLYGYINRECYQKNGVGYLGEEELKVWRNSTDFFGAVPPILLTKLPVDKLITVKEVVNLISLRNLKPILDKWDKLKIDDEPLPNEISRERCKWLSEDLVQWSSEDETRTVVFTILKKYGWLCSAITQFWNWWWSPDHKKEHDLEVLKFSIQSALEDRENWIVDVQDYFYGAGKQAKKAERAVDITGFCVRFGFEHTEIRDWLWFNLDKNSTLHIEEDEDKLKKDWKNLYKFFHCWEFYSACSKQLNPYLTRMDEDCAAVVGKTRDGCEILEEGIKADRFVTRFKICQVVSKRSSGFFHTMSPNSDELSVIEAPEGKLLTYFDVDASFSA